MENQDPNLIIVIGREFGSGGRTIGKIVAEKLGIDYYDTKLLTQAAATLGAKSEVFRDHEEKRPSVLKTLLQGIYGIPDNFHSVPIGGDRVYQAQCDIIRKLAKKGSCVIVGRNADFILKDHPGLVSIFLHSPLDQRIRRILSRNEAATEEEAREMAQKHDRRRESFYNYYTGEKRWGNASNYHLSVDTSYLENDEAADLIIKFARAKNR